MPPRPQAPGNELYKAISDTSKESNVSPATKKVLKYREALWAGYKELNEAIFSQPYLRPHLIGKITGKTSRTTLTKYVNELVSCNILRPKKDGVEVFYLNDDLIRILEG